MLAKKTQAHFTTIEWCTPTTLRLKFEVDRPFHFQPGQFIALIIPALDKKNRSLKRLYSLVSTPEEAKSSGQYELCVKYVAGGIGSEFLSRSHVGETLSLMAPYGDFQFRPSSDPSRSACFLATGSGIAPIRSIVLSEAFQKQRPRDVLCVLGVRTEAERLFAEDFEKAGVKVVYAVSQPILGEAPTFQGRVTDFLKQLPAGWGWHTTDYYLCGNSSMITEVDQLLRGSHGVAREQIHKEAFASPQPPHGAKVQGAKILPFPSRESVQESETALFRKILKAR